MLGAGMCSLWSWSTRLARGACRSAGSGPLPRRRRARRGAQTRTVLGISGGGSVVLAGVFVLGLGAGRVPGLGPVPGPREAAASGVCGGAAPRPECGRALVWSVSCRIPAAAGVDAVHEWVRSAPGACGAALRVLWAGVGARRGRPGLVAVVVATR